MLNKREIRKILEINDELLRLNDKLVRIKQNILPYLKDEYYKEELSKILNEVKNEQN